MAAAFMGPAHHPHPSAAPIPSDTPLVGLWHYTLGFVLTQGVVKLQLVVLVQLECIKLDKWDIGPRLIDEGTMYNLTTINECSQLLIQE